MANSRRSILTEILQKLAPEIGATLLIEPDWNIAGQITFQSGRRRYFRYTSVDLNSVGSTDIAKDKDYANFFMREMGYPTIEGQAFYSKDWCIAIGSDRDISAAYLYAQSLGFPVIVKPNSGSQGSGVTKVHTKREFMKALRHIFKKDRVALVQRVVQGKDFRVVVLDDEIISAYQRIPLNVVGDGVATLEELLIAKQRAFAEAGRDTVIRFDDPRIVAKVTRDGYSLESIPKSGERVFLLDNANLSTGGDSVDVTEIVHPEFKRIAIALTKDMGLRLCGVDLMVAGEISDSPDTYWVIEINAAPGLDHYANSGQKQREVVEAMYRKVLQSLDR